LGWITTKIQAQYFLDPEIKPWNIDVTTNSAGVVTLRGVVEEAADRDEAVRIARETEGVSRVDNQLRVKAEAPTAADTTRADDQAGDGWITAKVQAKFFVDPDVKGRNIDVETQNRVVTLRGDVETEAEPGARRWQSRAAPTARTSLVEEVRQPSAPRPMPADCLHGCELL
jgi:osmotically-inducible protein OsmY